MSGPLKTDFPAIVPQVEGFLDEDQKRKIRNEVDNLLVDVANQFHAAGHNKSYEAAGTYLAQLNKQRELDELPAQQ